VGFPSSHRLILTGEAGSSGPRPFCSESPMLQGLSA
jgi:hypothetical protein